MPIIKAVAIGGLTIAGVLGTHFEDWKAAKEKESEIALRTEHALDVYARDKRRVTEQVEKTISERCNEVHSERVARSQERLQTYEEAAALIPKPEAGGPVCPKNCRVP